MNETQFASAVLQRLGVKPSAGALQAMVGWMHAEGGHWHNDAKYNPLNTTQTMPGAGNTGSQGNIKVYRNWQQGVDATVKTLQYGAYKGIIAGLRQGNPSSVAAAIGHSPWGTSGGLVASAIASAPRGLHGGQVDLTAFKGGGAQAPAQRGPATTTTSFDQAGYDKARKLAILGNYLSTKNPNNPLLKLGVATPGALPDRQAFQTTTTVPGSLLPTSAPPAASSGGGGIPVSGGKTLTTTFGGVTAHIKAGDIPTVARASDVHNLKGVVEFDGKPVAAWVGYVLHYARRHGWKGGLSEGYRTDGQQTGIYNSGVRPAAVPKSLGGGGSNHEVETFPGGAADVNGAAELASILARSPYRSLLQWAGSKDPPHFSHPHNGSY